MLEIWGAREGVHTDRGLENDDYAVARKLDVADGGERGDFNGGLGLVVVPDDCFVGGEFWGVTAADEGEVVCHSHHFDETDACIEVP